MGGDGLALQRSYGVDVRGCLELELLLTRTINCGGIHGFSGGTSLKALSYSLLNVELDKNPQLRCSDWSERYYRKHKSCMPLLMLITRGQFSND